MDNPLFVPTITSSLTDWLSYIKCLHPVSINLTLDRIRKIAINLELIHPAKCVILVGGTNGKGTTCYLLETILLNSNIRVGLYTSPHLLSYNERIRICGKELLDEIHIQALSIIEKYRCYVELTYFEFSTLSALYIFKQEKLDVVILEVGLGGRLDATNIVDADISVITNVAIDHVEFLGVNRDMIATEKSGIVRANKPAIIGGINRPTVIDRIVKHKGAILFALGRDWNYCSCMDKWSWWDYNNYKVLSLLPIPMIPLENAAVTLGILYWLPFLISRVAIDDGLRTIFVPGRFQIVQYNPLLILDVGHNLHAASYLVDRLSVIISKMGDSSSVRGVIGMLKHKDIQGTIDCLSLVVDFWYFATLNTSLSADSAQLSDCLICSVNVQKFNNILDAWKQAMLDAASEDCVVVFGSFYAVGPVLKEIVNKCGYL